MAKSSKGAGKSLVRASLSIHEPPRGKSTTPGGLIRTFHFDFNPAQLTISRGANWKFTPSPAVRKGSKPEFLGPEPREMTVEVFLDSSGEPTGNTVLKKVEALLGCCETTARSIAAKQPSPPWVVFEWGRSPRPGSRRTSPRSRRPTRSSGPLGCRSARPARCGCTRSPRRPRART